jgi:hypothetical protein
LKKIKVDLKNTKNDRSQVFLHNFLSKTDDDTYIVMENLRHMLYPLNTDESHYIGAHYYNDFVKPNGFNHGGSGYLLSRKSLEEFVLQVCVASDLVIFALIR